MLDRGNARPESSSSIPSLHASLDLTSIPTETIPYSPADKALKEMQGKEVQIQTLIPDQSRLNPPLLLT